MVRPPPRVSGHGNRKSVARAVRGRLFFEALLEPGGSLAAPLPQPPDRDKDRRRGEPYDPLDARERLEVVVEHLIREEHLHGYVHEESGAGVDEYGEPVQEGGEQRGPEDDQRYRRREADHEQPEVDLPADPGSADQCDHVVERHDGVGHDNDPDRLPRALAGLDLLLPFLDLVVEELPGDPDEQETTDDLQEGDLQKQGDDGREDESQYDRPGGAPDDRLPALGAVEAAGGHGDDHGVVAGKDEVDGQYLDECDPENRLGQRAFLLRPLPARSGGRVCSLVSTPPSSYQNRDFYRYDTLVRPELEDAPDRRHHEGGVQYSADEQVFALDRLLALEQHVEVPATEEGEYHGEYVQPIEGPVRERETQSYRHRALEDHRPGYVAQGKRVLVAPQPDDGVELLRQFRGQGSEHQRDQTRRHPHGLREVLDGAHEEVGADSHHGYRAYDLRRDGPGRRPGRGRPQGQLLGRFLLLLTARLYGLPDEERVSHDQPDRQNQLRVEGQRQDSGRGAQGKEGKEIEHISLGGPLVHRHRIPALPATSVDQNRDSRDEHRERGEEARRTEDGADAYLTGGARAGEERRHDGHHRDHGLRQGGPDGGEHAPHRAFVQVQPFTEDLDGVGEQGGRHHYRCRGERQFYDGEHQTPLLRVAPRDQTRSGRVGFYPLAWTVTLQP